jgi:hypothetical protein
VEEETLPTRTDMDLVVIEEESPSRLNMKQEAHPEGPKSMRKKKAKKPLTLGNQIGLKVANMWINLESRLPFAHYRIQDELLRLKVCRMKTKGLEEDQLGISKKDL